MVDDLLADGFPAVIEDANR